MAGSGWPEELVTVTGRFKAYEWMRCGPAPVNAPFHRAHDGLYAAVNGNRDIVQIQTLMRRYERSVRAGCGIAMLCFVQLLEKIFSLLIQIL